MKIVKMFDCGIVYLPFENFLNGFVIDSFQEPLSKRLNYSLATSQPERDSKWRWNTSANSRTEVSAAIRELVKLFMSRDGHS